MITGLLSYEAVANRLASPMKSSLLAIFLE